MLSEEPSLNIHLFHEAREIRTLQAQQGSGFCLASGCARESMPNDLLFVILHRFVKGYILCAGCRRLAFQRLERKSIRLDHAPRI